MFCNKTGLWWAIVESELHPESGDLNLATCLAGTGESNNMWRDGKVSAPGRGGSTPQKLSRVITQSNATCQGNLDDSVVALFIHPGLFPHHPSTSSSIFTQSCHLSTCKFYFLLYSFSSPLLALHNPLIILILRVMRLPKSHPWYGASR